MDRSLEQRTEISLQKVASFWLDRLERERQISAAATAAAEADKVELDELEAEYEAVTHRLEVMGETLSLVAGRLDSMEDAMEAAEQRAKEHVQRVAAFWIQRLEAARDAKGSTEEAAAQVRLAKKSEAEAKEAMRVSAARAAETVEAKVKALVLRREHLPTAATSAATSAATLSSRDAPESRCKLKVPYPLCAIIENIKERNTYNW